MQPWAHDAVFYHMYPLGLCGAPRHNALQGSPEPRLAMLEHWIEPLCTLGVNAVYLGPLFEASAHGYDTADYYHVDRRLGTDETLTALAAALHAKGIRLILDGVFHHVGRDFWAFRDLLAYGQQSRYADWFDGINFGQRSPYGDPFSYAAWEGHYNLVKLNLRHPEVRAHLLDAVRSWIERFAIDGLRLDVAERVDLDFLRELAGFSKSLRPDFWLLGEQVMGDYRRIVGPTLLDSATNYELYKGLYSSHNDRNYFEIAYALNRQFGPAGIYRGLPLYNFADNHDVSRVATLLHEPAHLALIYLLLFTMPGVPAIYYGSEWGLRGAKRDGDEYLRPHLTLPEAPQQAPHPQLAQVISRLARVRHDLPALRHGDYQQLAVAHEQLAFARHTDGQSIIVAVNAAGTPAHLNLPVGPGAATWFDALNQDGPHQAHAQRLSLELPPHWGRIMVCNKG